MRSARATVAALLVGLVVGCSGEAGRVSPSGDPGKLALQDFGEMLKGLPSDGKKPPTKMSELEPMLPAAPVGSEALQSKKIVYLWGAGYVQGGTKVVAYETKAEAEGGYVLLEDGTVKTMTADELKAAPKAGKK